MSAGHFCCVFEDELWVFPGPGNIGMRRIHCLNLQTYRWGASQLLSNACCQAACPRMSIPDLQACSKGSPTCLTGCSADLSSQT